MSSFNEANKREREEETKETDYQRSGPKRTFSEKFRKALDLDTAEGWTQEDSEDYFSYGLDASPEYLEEFRGLPSYKKFGDSIDDKEGMIRAPDRHRYTKTFDVIEDGKEKIYDKNTVVEANLLDNYVNQQLQMHSDMLRKLEGIPQTYNVRDPEGAKERKYLRDELKDFVKDELGRLQGPKLFWKNLKSGKSRREVTGKGYKRKRKLNKNRGDVQTEAARIRKHLDSLKHN